MAAQVQWLVTNPWGATGLVCGGALLGMLVAWGLQALRRRVAVTRERRAARFRQAVRREAHRIAMASRPKVVAEVDDYEVTRVFERPCSDAMMASGVRPPSQRESAGDVDLAATTVLDRSALLAALGDVAG